jgi:hypothetical protein
MRLAKDPANLFPEVLSFPKIISGHIDDVARPEPKLCFQKFMEIGDPRAIDLGKARKLAEAVRDCFTIPSLTN